MIGSQKGPSMKFGCLATKFVFLEVNQKNQVKFKKFLIDLFA